MRFVNWFLSWKQKRPVTDLPLGVSSTELEGLKQLVASPHWRHYKRVLDTLGEQQAGVLSSGLPHDQYLFASGTLTAIRRIYTVVDDLIASAAKLEEHTDARTRESARVTQRHAATFVNTPWFDGWRSVEGAGNRR